LDETHIYPCKTSSYVLTRQRVNFHVRSNCLQGFVENPQTRTYPHYSLISCCPHPPSLHIMKTLSLCGLLTFYPLPRNDVRGAHARRDVQKSNYLLISLLTTFPVFSWSHNSVNASCSSLLACGRHQSLQRRIVNTGSLGDTYVASTVR